MSGLSDAAFNINPPWQIPEFFTEDGLRAAQEYYFQTHAKHTRMIAEARNAQGISKSFVRRKLTREMGEDFKMYTGTTVGQAAGDNMESLGIRGEMNALLGHIYKRIAPGAPITSPAQEDATILTHPHGGLEVCYAMMFFFTSLMRKYASLASNRRKVLRSIMDEEMFKWVWRLVIAYMMAPQDRKISLENSTLSSGLEYIPPESQQAPLGQKLYEVGMFLLSKSMQESELRLVISYFFVTYLRQYQTALLMNMPHREVDGLLKIITSPGETAGIEHPLVAVDRLMNAKGTSMQSFDDILREGGNIQNLVPKVEADFINQFEDFGNPSRLAATLRRIIPDPRKEPEENQHTTLMPLLLMLRTMPPSIRDLVLSKLPVPILNMVRNRITNTTMDDVNRDLMDQIRSFLDIRRQQGETYTIAGRRAEKSAVASSVRVPQPAEKPPEVQSTPAPPSPETPPAAPAEAAPPDTGPEETPGTADEPGGLLDERAIVAWQMDGAKLSTVSLSAREVMTLSGNELRFVLPWVVFSLRTGQVFGIGQDKINKETVETLVSDLRDQFGQGADGSLHKDQLLKITTGAKGASMNKVLLALAQAAGMERFRRAPPALAPVLAELEEKFGDQLEVFLNNPGQDAFKELRAGLSASEKQTLAILQRVARSK